MPTEHLVALSAAFAVVAFMYASVGHAGASGYIAIMSLAGFAPESIRPVALVLNILVAVLATWHFWRAGHFSWRLFWPFAIASMPCAFLGGYLELPRRGFTVLVGAVLLYSSYRFFAKPSPDREAAPPRPPVAMATGAGLGLLAGLTGTGGGIFLTPLLLFKNWAQTKPAAAVSALFILVNSAAGLVGNLVSTSYLPAFTGYLALAAVTGGFAGSYFGSRKFPPAVIKKMLAAILLIAGLKLIFT